MDITTQFDVGQKVFWVLKEDLDTAVYCSGTVCRISIDGAGVWYLVSKTPTDTALLNAARQTLYASEAEMYREVLTRRFGKLEELLNSTKTELKTVETKIAKKAKKGPKK